MNKDKFKSIMVLNGDTIKSLAKSLGISEVSLSYKINETKSEFKVGEMSKIRARYSLSSDQIVDIFFT